MLEGEVTPGVFPSPPARGGPGRRGAPEGAARFPQWKYGRCSFGGLFVQV